MKIFLGNILGISDGRCDFFGVCLFSGRKKGGVKKKVPKNCVFLCFFQKMTIFWPTSKFLNFVIFVNEALKQDSNTLLKRILRILGWIMLIRILFLYFYGTCGKIFFFQENLKFFSQGIYCCFCKKNNFCIFFSLKFCHFRRGKMKFCSTFSRGSK